MHSDDLYFCENCVQTLREVTDHWKFGGTEETACAFCGDDDHDGDRISAEFVTKSELGTTTSFPVYDLCLDCTEIFSTFLAGERVERFQFGIPDGWDVFGSTSRHLVGFGTEHDRVYVDPAVKRSRAGVQSLSAGLSEADANCYAILVLKHSGTASERPSEIAAFENADDAIAFACLVALYAAQAPSSIESIDSDFDPETDQWTPAPIISDLDPRVVAERMLGDKSCHLEHAFEQHAQAN